MAATPWPLKITVWACAAAALAVVNWPLSGVNVTTRESAPRPMGV